MNNQEITASKNRETIVQIGDMVEALFDEVYPLPLSDEGKGAMVMIYMTKLFSCKGNLVTLLLPLDNLQLLAA